jgi:molybdopterin converting factor small subunit
MNVRIRLFARARDLAGCDTLELALATPVGAWSGDHAPTVRDVRRELAVVCPALGAILERSALAVNEEWADDQTSVPPGAEVAVLPPVSGG